MRNHFLYFLDKLILKIYLVKTSFVECIYKHKNKDIIKR